MGTARLIPAGRVGRGCVLASLEGVPGTLADPEICKREVAEELPAWARWGHRSAACWHGCARQREPAQKPSSAWAHQASCWTVRTANQRHRFGHLAACERIAAIYNTVEDALDIESHGGRNAAGT